MIYLKLPVIVMAVVPFHNAVKHVICSSIFVGKHFMPSFYTKTVRYYILSTSQCGIPWIHTNISYLYVLFIQILRYSNLQGRWFEITYTLKCDRKCSYVKIFNRSIRMTFWPRILQNTELDRHCTSIWYSSHWKFFNCSRTV